MIKIDRQGRNPQERGERIQESVSLGGEGVETGVGYVGISWGGGAGSVLFFGGVAITQVCSLCENSLSHTLDVCT